MFDQEDEQTLLEKVEKLQASLVGYATQDGGGLEIADFMRLRQEIMNDGNVKGEIPDIIRRYRNQGQFWQGPSRPRGCCWRVFANTYWMRPGSLTAAMSIFRNFGRSPRKI
jgi:hypothetical protein